MEGLPLGAHFQPTDQEILFYLRYYAEVGQPLDGGFIMQGDLRYFQVEQPPDVRSLERLYYYTECFYRPVRGPPTRDRCTVDGRGCWNSREGQKTIYQSSEIVGYKQEFKFFFRPEPSGEYVSTSWAMTEYTLNSNRSNNKDNYS
ncbi:protein CUP-SHAPED COTYLEDON 3-like [Phoenix dactylifera]|uniref:Protein CUP-SHAPED COTYLEDON 3-like n=1 Tax=Phoenix dactylifera TaxID=42345 RepID=A0A8B9AGX4_PHODC|nr:protein CUP-SHAPED COTYLEDON 3-like [Phoenix dactylifera]